MQRPIAPRRVRVSEHRATVRGRAAAMRYWTSSVAAGLALISGSGFAQAPAATPVATATATPTTPTTVEWSAAALLAQCQASGNAGAQGECVGAVRGILHGYQYGVLLVGQTNRLGANKLESVSVCLNGVPVQTLINEFITDASQASPADLARTPAETVVLGVMHQHHRCE